MGETLMDITGVKSEHIPLIWPEVQPFLESALFYSEGEYHISDIYNLLMYHKMQLWVATLPDGLHGCAVTEILNYPQKQICSMVLMAGHSLDAWEQIADMIEQWAYDEGCDLVRNCARPGWKRRAAKHGYSQSYVVFTKTLRVNDENSH